MAERFKLAFPSIVLPENRGGLRAVVIFSVSDPKTPGVFLSTCIDEKGTPHMHVPLTRSEVQGAKPMVLIEAPGERAPTVGGGSGLVGVDGRQL